MQGRGECACLGVKNIGKQCALIAHAWFDEGGQARYSTLIACCSDRKAQEERNNAYSWFVGFTIQKMQVLDLMLSINLKLNFLPCLLTKVKLLRSTGIKSKI